MVGQNIGKYRVLDRIGRGGMGTVYRAMDETLHREVAIKVLNAELNDPEVAKRFRHEAITVARLSHPGIATIYELFQNEGQWLMVMEFVRGETLEKMAERMGTLSPQRTAELCMQTLGALAHAHSMGVVHRDLKPANIMITETGAIKIMDFGIARVAGTEHLTNAGFMMGTPAYMSPEQVMGKEIDARADLYAMGVVFYRLTTGKLPFRGDTPFAMAQSQVNDPPTPIGMFRSDLPPWAEQIVVRSLAKSPEERFQSAIEFHESFARCLAGLPMSAPYSSSAPTEILMTPPRAMPSGAFMRPPTGSLPTYPTPVPPSAPTQSTIAQPDAAFEPTVLSPTPIGTRQTSTPSGAIPQAPLAPLAPLTPAATPAPDPIAAAVTAPVPSAAPPSSAKLAAPAPAKVVKTPVGKSPAAGEAKKGSGALIGAAAAVLLVVAAGAMWMRSNRTPEPPPADTAAPPPADAAPAPAPADAAAPVPVPVTPAAPAAPDTVVRSTAAAPGSSAADAKGRGAAAAPAATSAPAPAVSAPAIVEEAPVSFDNIKLMTVNGKKTDDQDVSVTFGGGQVSLLAKRGGASVGAMPYRGIIGATFVKARDPKWNEALYSPPKGLDVGGMLRTSKPWLVLQGSDAYLILRLDDANARQVIQAVESRARITVSQPATTDKN